MMLKILPYDRTCVEQSYQFLMETFRISFGPAKQQWPNGLDSYNFEKYQLDMSELLEEAHVRIFGVYDEEKFIGQIELRIMSQDCGYVSFYYLKSEYRNRGLGKQLDEFAFAELKRLGCRKIRLTVSQLNKPGQRFYEKNGWKALEPDQKRPMGLTMEKVIS